MNKKSFLVVTAFLCFCGIKTQLYGFEKSSLKCTWDGGVKLNIPAFFDFSLAAYCNGNFSYGLQASFGKEKLPVEIKGGKLSFSGSYSLLNTMVISSAVSPFCQPSRSIKKLTGTLPSDAASSSKPLGFFVQMSGAKKNLYGTAFGAMDGKYGFSFGGKFKNSFGRLELDLTGLFSDYKGLFEKTDSWFEEEYFYREDTMFSSVFQSCLVIDDFAFLVDGMFFLNPFFKINSVFRGEISGKVMDNKFSLSGLYNPYHNVMTGGGRHYDELIQIKGNINRSLRTGQSKPLFWKWGTGAFYEGNLTDKSDSLKVSAGFRLTGLSFYINAGLQGDFMIHLPEESFPMYGSISKFSASLKNGYFLKRINPVFRFSFQGEPGKNRHILFTETAGINILLPVTPSVSMDFCGTFKQLEGQDKGGNIKTSMQIKWKTSNLTLSGKVSLSIEF